MKFSIQDFFIFCAVNQEDSIMIFAWLDKFVKDFYRQKPLLKQV